MLSSQKSQSIGRKPPKTTGIPARGSGTIRDQPEFSLDRHPLSSNTADFSQTSSSVVTVKEGERYKRQESLSMPLPEYFKARYSPSKFRGTTKYSAAAIQSASGQALSDNGYSSNMVSSGPGSPFNGEGKGKDPGPIDTKAFSTSWGFEGDHKNASTSPLREMTLLELLSCRKHELCKPHQADMGERPIIASITPHDHFAYEDVSGKCKTWFDFSFDDILTRFPFLKWNVPVPDELGILLLGA
jgi:hypothetical protein